MDFEKFGYWFQLLMLFFIGCLLSAFAFPTATDQNLSCQPHDVRHFEYKSQSNLWGKSGGTIEISSSLVIHCLGVDKEVPNALKYLVEISNLQAKPIKNNEINGQLRRSKRGIMSWLRETYEKVKRFVLGLFGSGNDEEEAKPSIESRSPSDTISSTTTTVPYDEEETFEPGSYTGVYDTAFEFVQSANGSIPEVRFAANDTDESALGFKRHLADIFATQFDPRLNMVEELTPIGRHKTRYAYEPGPPIETTTTQAPNVANYPNLKITRQVTSDDILQLATTEEHKSKGFNDINNIDLETVQVQQYEEGELVTADGILTLSLNDLEQNSRRRRKRKTHPESGLQVTSTFSIKLSHRRKRDITEEKLALDMEKELDFQRNSLMPTPSKRDNISRNRLETISIEIQRFPITLSGMIDPKNTDLVSLLLEKLQLEANLKIGFSETRMLLKEIFTKKELEKFCGETIIDRYACSVSLTVAASVGGIENQNVLLNLMKTWRENENEALAIQLGESLALVPDPTSEWLSSISEVILEAASSNLAGVTLIIPSLSKIFKKESLPDRDIHSTMEELVKAAKLRTNLCTTDHITETLLETIAETGLWNQGIIDLANRCPKQESYSKSLVKGFGTSFETSSVQSWLVNVLESASCSLTVAVVKTLISKTKSMRFSGEYVWPAIGFNSVDKKLKEMLLRNNGTSCASKEILGYFFQKDNDEASRAILEVDQLLNVPRRRRKRDLIWDDESCDDWTSHAKDSNDPVDAFEQDGVMYNRWRHCNKHQNFGGRVAKATYQGGMFVGAMYPSDPPKYKVESQIKAAASFMSKEFDLGKVSFQIDENNTRAYVELLGRNILDLKGTNCTEDEFYFRPAQEIPLFSMDIWMLQFSLGLHLGVDATMAFKCPKGETKNDYLFLPATKFRVAGEASGKILMLKGGINLGGNFNYRLKTRLHPYPGACFSAKEIYDPMSLSIETWYKYYDLFSNDWSRRHRWTPNLLEWGITDTKEEDWVKHYCALPGSKTESS